MVAGVSIVEASGAFKVTPSRTTPDEVSTVDLSVIAIIEKLSCVAIKLKSPFASDLTEGSILFEPVPSSHSSFAL